MVSAWQSFVTSRGAVFLQDTEPGVVLAPAAQEFVARGQKRVFLQDQSFYSGGSSVSGTGSFALDPLTVAAVGSVTNRGAASFTLGDLTVSAIGDSDPQIVGNADIVLDPLTVAATGHNAATAQPLTNAQMQELYLWLSELHLIHGLRAGSPLAVSQSTRVAGPVSQAVGEAGGTVTVVRQ